MLQPEIHANKQKEYKCTACVCLRESSKCVCPMRTLERQRMTFFFSISVRVVVVRKPLCMHDRFDAPDYPSIGCHCNKIMLSDRKVLIENFATDFLCACFALSLSLPLSACLILFFFLFWTARLARLTTMVTTNRNFY